MNEKNNFMDIIASLMGGGKIRIIRMPEKRPVLQPEEKELADSLIYISKKYGKFNEDGKGIWAGYDSPEENKVKDIGVKCANCILYQGGSTCSIIAMPVQPEGKCRFAVLPDGVVQGDK